MRYVCHIQFITNVNDSDKYLYYMWLFFFITIISLG